MNEYEQIRAALEFADLATGGKLIPKDSTIQDALTALAELERMAGDPVAWRRDGFTFFVGDGWDVPPDGAFPLYAAPPIPQVAAAPQPQVDVTDAMCERVSYAFAHQDYSGAEITPMDRRKSDARLYLRLWQAELGTQLGLAVWREPSDSECREIARIYNNGMNFGETLGAKLGRDAYAAVRDVMGGGE